MAQLTDAHRLYLYRLFSSELGFNKQTPLAEAASVLERAGHHDVAVAAGGPDDWAQASGTSLERLA